MPDNIVKLAQTAGRMNIACTFDLAEAFMVFKLGPMAQKLRLRRLWANYDGYTGTMVGTAFRPRFRLRRQYAPTTLVGA